MFQAVPNADYSAFRQSDFHFLRKPDTVRFATASYTHVSVQAHPVSTRSPKDRIAFRLALLSDTRHGPPAKSIAVRFVTQAKHPLASCFRQSSFDKPKR